MDDRAVTTDQLREGLKKFFGYDDYKSELQQKATEEVAKCTNDVFISMPTGAGKSLCYMLPGAVGKGVTVVVSPLLALMQDQLNVLRNAGIPATTINSLVPEEDRVVIEKELRQEPEPRYKFLYLTPEQCATSRMRGVLGEMTKKNFIRGIAVDEAHCISEWGHQFRFDYLKLGELRFYCPKVPFIALTATAPKIVAEDCLKRLKLSNVVRFKQPVFRPNLFYEVVAKNPYDEEENVDSLMKYCTDVFDRSGPGQKSGIIYCRTRQECENVALRFEEYDVPIKAAAYHAGLDNREQTQAAWMNGEIQVVCATISFGMGIDNRHVRFVVHWNLAQALGSYYQEAGRAGRDGQQAYCRLYYSPNDAKSIEWLIKNDIDKKVAEKKPCNPEPIWERFHSMVNYCKTNSCRHAMIAAFFDDEAPQCNKSCDYCKAPKKIQKKSSSSLQNYNASQSLPRYSTSQPSFGSSSGSGCSKNRKGNKIDDNDDHDDDWREGGLSRDTREGWKGDQGDDHEARSSGMTDIIRSEFAKRRHSSESDSMVDPKKRVPRNCVLKHAQASKIKRLSVDARMNALQILIDAILASSNPENSQNRALDLEYKAYEAATLAQRYKLNIDGYKKSILAEGGSSSAPEATPKFQSSLSVLAAAAESPSSKGSLADAIMPGPLPTASSTSSRVAHNPKSKATKPEKPKAKRAKSSKTDTKVKPLLMPHPTSSLACPTPSPPSVSGSVGEPVIPVIKTALDTYNQDQFNLATAASGFVPGGFVQFHCEGKVIGYGQIDELGRLVPLQGSFLAPPGTQVGTGSSDHPVTID